MRKRDSSSSLGIFLRYVEKNVFLTIWNARQEIKYKILATSFFFFSFVCVSLLLLPFTICWLPMLFSMVIDESQKELWIIKAGKKLSALYTDRIKKLRGRCSVNQQLKGHYFAYLLFYWMVNTIIVDEIRQLRWMMYRILQ